MSTEHPEQLSSDPETLDRMKNKAEAVKSAVAKIEGYLANISASKLTQQELEEARDSLESALQFAELTEHNLRPTRAEDDAKANESVD